MSPQSKRSPEGLSYLFLTLTIVSIIGTVISGFLAFAYGNELSLPEAIDSGLVRANIRGMAEDGRFTEPMLEVTLTKQTVWPMTVVIPQGLTVEGTEGGADLVTGQTEKISLLGFEEAKKQLCAYSLDYSKPFPNSDSQYDLETLTINKNLDLTRLLDNIVYLKAEKEIASQLVVWAVYNEVKVEEISEALGISPHMHRVNEIREKDTPLVAPPSDFWLWLAIFIFSSTLTIVFGTRSKGFLLFWKGPNQNTTVSDAARDQPDDEMAEVKPLMIDHLEDWQSLAKGGMAEVYTAIEQRSGHKVVVKFPRRDSNGLCAANIKFRFEQEIKHHQKMTHANIVQFLEHGKCIHPRHGHETAYLIQEFIKGHTIFEVLHKNGYRKLDDRLFSKVVDVITEVLKYIHKKNVVHRDITWKNVMVDHRGEVYLIDFGNATEFDSTDTRELGHGAVGTPLFYAPLKLMGNIPARDFYSLVMLIYAMYAGKSILGLSERLIEQDMREMYNNLNGVPRSVRKALEWRLTGDYENSGSTEIRIKHFPTVREMMMEMIEKGSIKTKFRTGGEKNDPDDPDDFDGSGYLGTANNDPDGSGYLGTANNDFDDSGYQTSVANE